MSIFNDNALRFAPWSLSKLQVATDCGFRFKLKYIQKKKEAVAVDPAGRVGSAAHKALELILKGESAERAFRVGAHDNKLTTNEIDELYTFRENITKFIERIKKFEAKHPIRKKLIEHQFGLTRDLKPTTFFGKEVFFRGVVDMGLELVEPTIIIIDHKSGQPSTDISKYSAQLKFYAVASRILYPKITGVQSALHYIRTGDVVWGEYVPTSEIDGTYMRWFSDFINSSVENLSDAPKRGWYCRFCGYQTDCPLMKGE